MAIVPSRVVATLQINASVGEIYEMRTQSKQHVLNQAAQAPYSFPNKHDFYFLTLVDLSD